MTVEPGWLKRKKTEEIAYSRIFHCFSYLSISALSIFAIVSAGVILVTGPVLELFALNIALKVVMLCCASLGIIGFIITIGLQFFCSVKGPYLKKVASTQVDNIGGEIEVIGEFTIHGSDDNAVLSKGKIEENISKLDLLNKEGLNKAIQLVIKH